MPVGMVAPKIFCNGDLGCRRRLVYDAETLHRPSKPLQNGAVESFNGRLRDGFDVATEGNKIGEGLEDAKYQLRAAGPYTKDQGDRGKRRYRLPRNVRFESAASLDFRNMDAELLRYSDKFAPSAFGQGDAVAFAFGLDRVTPLTRQQYPLHAGYWRQA